MNQGRLSHPQRNQYKFSNASVSETYVPAPPLDYNSSTGSITARANSASAKQNASDFAYTISPELAQAAKIVAEGTTHADADGSDTDIAQIIAKYRVPKNDTNTPWQTHVAPNGLGGFIPYNAQMPLISINETSSHSLAERSEGDFWLTEIAQNGESPFAPAGYKVIIPFYITFRKGTII